MLLSLLLIVAGLLMIFLEFFLPGGIMGGIGVLVLLGNIIFTALNSDSLLPVIFVIILTGGGVVAVAKIALWKIRRGDPETSVYLKKDQEGYKASQFADETIGEEGETLSTLSPSGHVLVQNVKYQALSKTGFIEKGTTIVVTGGEGAHLIVKKISKEG